ncbi:MAG: glycosyltransferase family 2 protein [Candidatus Omnitrophota bacterium]
MSTEQKVSIIIINWNGKNDTLECLESVSRIDYRNYEVILVDNGSTDGSLEDVRARFKDTVIIENKENKGFCLANNIGIRYALRHGADYLFILNNDTVVEPGIIHDLMGSLRQQSRLSVVSPLIAFYDDRQRMQFSGSRIDWGNGDQCRQYEWEYIAAQKGLLEIDFASWCAVFFKREVIERVGLLDEDFFAYYEDVEWGVRGAKLGIKSFLYPKVLVYHKGSRATGGVYSASVYFYLFRNRFLLIKKHAPLLRKLQFSVTYVSDSVNKSRQLAAGGKQDLADAVMDGVCSALSGAWKQDRRAFPRKYKGGWSVLRKVRLWGLAIKALFSNSSGK